MTRDNLDRLALMIQHDHGFSAVGRMELRRIALNMDQVQQYQPPPNPAKMSDSRAADYVINYGDESWELDALPPNVLVDLMNNHIDREIDQNAYNARRQHEEAERELLTLAAENWAEVSRHVDAVYR